jgi:alcohol dehydrogenase YqhD (iron-dependent ADH family)
MVVAGHVAKNSINLAGKFFTVNSLPATILAMNMERVFTQIDTNERNVFHDSSPNESLSSA